MNTIEKRKIESVINDDIEQNISTYKSNRASEYHTLKEGFEKNPPKEVSALLKKAQTLKDELNAVEKDVERLGWNMNSYSDKVSVSMKGHYDYSERNSRYVAEVKELVAHDKETDSTIQSLKELGRRYTLKIYAGSADMEKILNAFTSEISKLLK